MGRDLEIPLPPTRKVYVRIEDLADSANPDGKRVRLQQPSLHVLNLCRALDASEPGTEAWATALYSIAAALLPELTDAEVSRISAESVYGIIATANMPQAELEAIAKNGAPPSVRAEKGSNSETPSPTRSRGSRKPTDGRTAR